MIRDRKMYVAPTPFALTDGTTGLQTLIVPYDTAIDPRFREVGSLVRTEAATLVIGYSFDLRTNVLTAETAPNPRAGAEHRFTACRLLSQPDKPVSMAALAPPSPAEIEDDEDME